MNRKERRAAGRSGTASAPGDAHRAPPSATLADLFGAAARDHQAGALADAERRYRDLLTKFPDHTDSLHNLGLIALQRGDAASAVDLIAKAIERDKRIAEYHYNMALACRALGRTDQVITSLERAIKLRGDHALAHLNLGNIYREQGRLDAAVASYERAVAVAPNLAAAHFNLANVLLEQGRFDSAVPQYRLGLAINPDHAEALKALAVALMAQYEAAVDSTAPEKAREAAFNLERAIIIAPEIPGLHADLAKVYWATGELGLAVHAAARALEQNETEEGRRFFADCIRSVWLKSRDERLCGLVTRAFREGWGRPRDLMRVGISIVRLNSVMTGLIARATAAWPERLLAEELFGESGISALAQDRMLYAILEDNALMDVDLERVFTNVRHALLTRTTTAELTDERLLEFCCLVARQCFVNQYVYALTEAEARAAEQLRDSLDCAAAAGLPFPIFWPAIVGAYFPLHSLPHAAALLDRTWPQCVRELLVQQIAEPAQERSLVPEIPSLTGIDDEVSRAVRLQYEENPYPRWVKAGPPMKPMFLGDRAQGRPLDCLIAGCGTGLSTIELARAARDAHILAIDLSLASIAYAKRMAQRFELGNVEFAQADIMQIGSISRTFDFIDVSGVLHHLADPWAGWQALLSLLRPFGTMQVGLYSELARQDVAAARALIAQRGYRPILDDIRRCRQDIMATDDPLLKSLTRRGDFYSANDCRDLLFHVQEHRTSIPQIKAFLTQNGIKFSGFNLDASVLQRFAARFPGRLAMFDLDRWHEFETESPETFAGMYQFWVRKP